MERILRFSGRLGKGMQGQGRIIGEKFSIQVRLSIQVCNAKPEESIPAVRPQGL